MKLSLFYTCPRERKEMLAENIRKLEFIVTIL